MPFARNALAANRSRASCKPEVKVEGERKMFSRLVKQMAEREGVTENLKAESQIEWITKMNNIRSRAMETVNAELIFG